MLAQLVTGQARATGDCRAVVDVAQLPLARQLQASRRYAGSIKIDSLLFTQYLISSSHERHHDQRKYLNFIF